MNPQPADAHRHRPVLTGEMLAALRPHAGGRYVDATLGRGGHAEAILRASGPDGRLFGCDRDGTAIAAARERLAPFGERVELRQGNFDRLAGWLPAASCDGVLLDLGVSSPQLDDPERGFSFLRAGPLDMRMDPSAGPTAADVVNGASAADLARIFFEYGDERHARRLARAIVERREVAHLKTTVELADLIARVVPRGAGRIHPATRAFQALRCHVNDEPGSLRRGLAAAWQVLQPGGRLAVITFQSLEARLVKEFGRARTRDYRVEGDQDLPAFRRPRPPEGVWITRRPLAPSAPEVAANPRARSATLRVLEKR